MNRRLAIQSGIAAALVAASGVYTTAAAARHSVLKPRRLAQGNTIGLIAPASNAIENEDISFAADIVRSLGFKVREGKYLYTRNEYLAGTDLQRAEDVNRMFGDRSVDAIFCLRGGYGTPRILPHLDFDLIGKNPKVLMGYSDITALLLAIYAQTGLVSFHGPIANQTYTDYTLAEFRKVLIEPAARTIIGQAPPFAAAAGKVESENRITRFVGGTARGRLIGGNLSLLTTLIGTPFEPNFRNALLFLEDVGEAPYRVDRMLTQLWLAGKLQQVAGIAFGKFTDQGDDSENSFSMEEVIRMRCEPLQVPTIRGLMIGHIDDQTVVPIGIEAELDADLGTLTLLEPAVS